MRHKQIFVSRLDTLQTLQYLIEFTSLIFLISTFLAFLSLLKPIQSLMWTQLSFLTLVIKKL